MSTDNGTGSARVNDPRARPEIPLRQLDELCTAGVFAVPATDWTRLLLVTDEGSIRQRALPTSAHEPPHKA